MLIQDIPHRNAPRRCHLPSNATKHGEETAGCNQCRCSESSCYPGKGTSRGPVLLTSAPSTQGQDWPLKRVHGQLGSRSLTCHSFPVRSFIPFPKEETRAVSSPPHPHEWKTDNPAFTRNIQWLPSLSERFWGWGYYYILVLSSIANQISIFLLHRV